VAGAGADETAVGGNELDRGDAIGSQPIAAGQPADSPAQGVAGHAYIRRGARERGQAMLTRRDRHVLPQGAGLGAGGTADRVDADAAHPRCPQQHGAPERLECLGAVAGALGGDPHAMRAGEPDRLRHVPGRFGHHDDRGPLVGGQVPGLACLVIVGVAHGENPAGDRRPQRFQVAADNGVRGSHCPLFLQEWVFAARLKARPPPMAENNSRCYPRSNDWYGFLVIPDMTITLGPVHLNGYPPGLIVTTSWWIASWIADRRTVAARVRDGSVLTRDQYGRARPRGKDAGKLGARADA
jgi:hypothetical protein